MCFLHYGRENVCKHVKFAFQNRLGQPYSWEEIYRFCFVLLCIWGQFPSKAPPGGYIWRGDLTEGFLRYEFEGLIIGEAYFLNFTVYERAGILLVDVYESVGKFFISVCKMPKSAYRCVSWLWKSRDNVLIFIFQWQGYERVSLLEEVSHNEAKMRGRSWLVPSRLSLLVFGVED